METPISDLLSQRDALEKQIKLARIAERAKAVNEIRRLMSEHGLKPSDLSAGQRPVGHSAPKRTVAIKYRDASTGATWTGRGLRPKWLVAALEQGRTLSDFAV